MGPHRRRCLWRRGRRDLGVIERPTRADLITYTAAMLLLIAVGVLGALLHIDANLIAGGTVVPERFIRGTPFLAPLLFCNMGALGLITLLDPTEMATQAVMPMAI